MKLEVRRQKSEVTSKSLLLTSAFLLLTSAASAQLPFGQTVVEVVLEQEGRRIEDPLIRGLVETEVGQPLSMRDVRETMDHLSALRRFEDVQPTADTVPGGVRLRYVLVPAHPIDRVEFEGSLGLREGELRGIVTDRFGRAPAANRVDEVVTTLRQAYRDRGYPAARVTPRIEQAHDPDRATLFLDVVSGRRVVIADVSYIARNPEEQSTLTDVPRLREGQPYDREEVERALREWEDRMRALGYYEARATHGPAFPDDAYVRVTLTRGPRVVLQFSGDPLPADEQDRLVPIRAEASADEDLLEDASRNIEDYLRDRGYRDATAPYLRDESLGELIITFNVTRGPRYVVDAVATTGNTALPAAELDELIAIRNGDVFVQSTLQARATNIENTYRARGFTQAEVTPVSAVVPSEGAADRDRRVEIRIGIVEGPRATVRSVAFDGHMALTEAQLRALVTPVAGMPFSAVQVRTSRDAIDLEYRNRGYAAVAVQGISTLSEDGEQADIRFVVREGPQSLIDHIIIVGNERTSTETIMRELRIYEDGPLGYTALLESQARLAAIGLFRRVDIQQLVGTDETRRDVLILIEEADPTLMDFAAGIEGGFRGRQDAQGQIEERFELAPRGSFTIGRRNFGGKNRAATLFTRVRLRSSDVVVSQQGIGVDEGSGSRAFNEYRVAATFAEPRAFATPADILFTAVQEQGVRTSFNFSRRLVRAESGLVVSPTLSVTGRYSFEQTRLFDQRVTDQSPIIDRLFPQVRLSRVAGSLVRDTRDDGLDPSRGAQIIVDADLAARAMGSEVGFVRTYLQAFTYRRLPMSRRVILALAGRLGVARGFERQVDGQTFADLPASERFFAGGDSSVRGFSLDRLGNAATINPETGFPSGGNAIALVNTELRVTVIPRWQAVGFFDAGNVFLRASALDLTDLRPAAGIGLRYFSDYLPLRIDLGFNLDRRELLPGRREQGVLFHVSFGQAF